MPGPRRGTVKTGGRAGAPDPDLLAPRPAARVAATPARTAATPARTGAGRREDDAPHGRTREHGDGRERGDGNGARPLPRRAITAGLAPGLVAAVALVRAGADVELPGSLEVTASLVGGGPGRDGRVEVSSTGIGRVVALRTNDPADYPALGVTRERRDGDPAVGGAEVLRGPEPRVSGPIAGPQRMAISALSPTTKR